MSWKAFRTRNDAHFLLYERQCIVSQGQNITPKKEGRKESPPLAPSKLISTPTRNQDILNPWPSSSQHINSPGTKKTQNQKRKSLSLRKDHSCMAEPTNVPQQDTLQVSSEERMEDKFQEDEDYKKWVLVTRRRKKKESFPSALLSSSDSDASKHLSPTCEDGEENPNILNSKMQCSNTLHNIGIHSPASVAASSSLSVLQSSSSHGSQSDGSFSGTNHEESKRVPTTTRGLAVVKKGKTLRLATKTYDKFEWSIVFSDEDWKRCWKNNKLNKFEWRDTLRTRFEENDPEHHILNFKESAHINVSKKRGLTLDGYAYCRSGECKWFAFLVEVCETNKPPYIDVFSCGKVNHPANLQRTSQLRGAARKRACAKLKTITPSKYQQEELDKLPDEAYLEGNLKGVKSDDVVHHVKMEAMAEEDNHRDDVFDVILERRKELLLGKENVFIQYIGEPFQVIMFSETQVRTIFNHYGNWRNRVVHFDATGSLVREILHEKRRVYLYAGVVNCDGDIVPLFEMISACHDQGSIGMVFLSFRRMCVLRLNRKWPCIGRVVTDFSFPIILAMMRQWNDTSLMVYLKVCYKYLCQSYTSHSMAEIIFIILCRNHWLKMVSSNLKQHSIKGEKKAIILEAIAAIIEARDIAQFDRLFASLCVLLLSEQKNTLTVKACLQLQIGSRADEILNPDVKNIAEELEEHAFEPTENLSSSPFYVHCSEIVTSIRTKLEEVHVREEEVEANPMHCPKFLMEKILPKYAPIVPLWTELLVEAREAKGDFVGTNANAEDYFKIEKHSTHEIMHNKVGRFVRIERNFVRSKIEKIKRGIITNPKSYKKKMEQIEKETLQENSLRTAKDTGSDRVKSKDVKVPKTESVLSHEPSVQEGREEAWKLKKFAKKRTTYFSGKKLGKVLASIVKEEKVAGSQCDMISEKEEENWHSPPKAEKEAIIPAQRVKQHLSISQSASKSIRNMAANVSQQPVEDMKDCVIISTVPADVKRVILKTYYKFYLPNYEPFYNLKYLQSLTTDEVQHIESIGKGDFQRPLFLFNESDTPLYIEDFMLLLSDSPLNSPLLDACIFILKKTYNDGSFQLLTTSQGVQIFTNSFEDTIPLNSIDIFQSSLLLIPHTGQSHWSLFVVDFKKKRYSLLDSAGKNPVLAKTLLRSFLNYLLLRQNKWPSEPKQDEELWRYYQGYKVSYQRDEVNCGIFVIRFVECILQKKAIAKFVPHQYRIKLAKLCIAESRVSQEQSILSQTAHDLLYERFPNGLFQSPTYYASCPEGDDVQFVVSHFGQGLVCIYGNVFFNLYCGEWLNTTIIDASLHIYMNEERRSQFINVSCSHSREIIVSSPCTDSILFNINIGNKTLIMPINVTQSHWCLIVANTAKKTYRHFDPLDLSTANKYMDKFLYFLQCRNVYSKEQIDVEKWTIPPDDMKKYPTQKDGRSCGVLVLLYALVQMDVMSVPDKFTPSKFRKQIAWNLLRETPEMRYLCLYCGKDEFSGKRFEKVCRMVQCDRCHRWVHFYCEEQFAGIVFTDVQSDSFVFTCRLCKKHVQTFN